MTGVMKKTALKVKIWHFEFLLQVASSIFSLSKNMKSFSLVSHVYYVFNKHFCIVCTMYQNKFATLIWKFFHAKSNTLGMHILHINIITCTNHQRYNLSLNTLSVLLFRKEFYLYIWKTMSKKSCAVCYMLYCYVDNGHRFLSTCNFTQ